MCIESILGGNPLSFSLLVTNSIKSLREADVELQLLFWLGVTCVILAISFPFVYDAVHVGFPELLESENMEVKNADCAQLVSIYLNEDEEYLSSSEDLAKKYFDVKCVSNQSWEVIP